MATTTDQELLDAYKAAELQIVTGRVSEFREANHIAKMLSLREIRDAIRELEQKIAAAASGSIFKPIRTVGID